MIKTTRRFRCKPRPPAPPIGSRRTAAQFGRAGLAGLLLLSAAFPAWGAEYHVHPSGGPAGDGTADRPFATIQRAADAAAPGDKVVVHGGTYREAVVVRRGGQAGRPIAFAAAEGETARISGCDPLDLKWTRHRGSIWKAQCAVPVRQLFHRGELMIEARWPNMSFDRLWDRSRWAEAGKGSRYGKIVDPALAATEIDWTGAIATLNVAHQFFTWTRTVERHEQGSPVLHYAADLDGITHYADKTSQWEDDRYCLTGKLEALDSPREWFYDFGEATLYFWPPDGREPAPGDLEHKTRIRGLSAEGIGHVSFAGLHLLACNFHFVGCGHLRVEDCHLRYQGAARRTSDPEADEFDLAETLLAGDDNRVVRCSFAWGPTSALQVVGFRNRVEDCLMHDFCWDGSLRHPMLQVISNGNEPAEDRSVVRYCTLLNCGNAMINYRGLPGHVIEYNHVHHGGLCCKDVALVYTGQPTCAGSVVRYNWVHDCYTEHLFKSDAGTLRGGLGIRGDDQTRSLTVHHNVVWNCGRDGIIVKGDNNLVCNNTVLSIGSPETPGNFINLHTEPEPEKWWRKQHPLLEVQNAGSRIANNAARTICGHNRGRPYPFAENLANNFTGADPMLEDPARWDFRPRKGSPLIDGGIEIPGIAGRFRGEAPDIGAYEFGGEAWVPGIRWDPRAVLGYRPAGFALERGGGKE